MALIVSQPDKKPKVTLPPVEPSKGLSPAEVATTAQQLIANIERVIVGKRDQIVQ